MFDLRVGRSWLSVLTPLLVLLAVPAAAGSLQPLQPRIVNGVNSVAYGVAALLETSTGNSFCTGTLVGCNTILTAAHCVCSGTGAECQPGGGQLLEPGEVEVYLQQGGIFPVDSIAVPANYIFGETSDVALLHLGREVTSVRPYGLNTASPVANGFTALIAGYGITQGTGDDSGIQRYGLVRTSPCTLVPDNPHVCWSFQAPIGPPGEDSNTCAGDSGGPMFLQAGGGLVVAGVTSGGASGDCTAPDSSWDAEVYFDRTFLQNAAAGDLGNTSCGDLPYIFDPSGSIVAVGGGELGSNTPQRLFQFAVPADSNRLRVALNGEDGPTSDPSDFDLYIQAGASVTPEAADCASVRQGPFEYCEIVNPQAGTWSFLADRQAGSGEIQLIVSVIFGAPIEEPEPKCMPDAKTLCIDDEPGDRRFQVEVTYDTVLGGGRNGEADTSPLASLGIDRGGIFSFFNPQNPEMLVKILDGCNNNGHFWVFYAATTTAGFELTVEDTQTGAVKVYTNPDAHPAEPVADTQAFATCP